MIRGKRTVPFSVFFLQSENCDKPISMKKTKPTYTARAARTLWLNCLRHVFIAAAALLLGGAFPVPPAAADGDPHPGMFTMVPAPAVQPDQLASLGSGLDWVREFWEKNASLGGEGEKPARFDDSLAAFIAESQNRCIPAFAEPQVWEKNPRYTVEDPGCGTRLFRCKVKSGDNASTLFRHWLSAKEAELAVKTSSKCFSWKKLKPGRVFSVESRSGEETPLRFFYDIDGVSRLVVEAEGEGFAARVEEYQFDTRLVRIAGTISTSLFDAMLAAGESSALAVQLSEVFGHQVNFVSEVQEGDTFEMVVEKQYLEQEFRSYGDIVAARFVNDGTVYEAYRFKDEEGRTGYFDAEGKSLSTQFLKAPLNFTRISSGYTLARRHPVFGKVRPHQGVDYAAPRGTPVKALGDGTVSFRGWMKGYGYTLIIKHSGGIETQYAHLSRFNASAKVGAKVEQGEVVAYVGASGVATGPHLDFRVKKNGKFVDPDTLQGSRSDPVAEGRLDEFKGEVEWARSLLDGTRILASK